MSVTKCLIRAAAAIGLALALLPGAKASAIYYNFSVTANAGSLTGNMASGSFSYDSSSIVPGGSNNSKGLLTALNFIWDGMTYTQATANTGWLSFDSGGNLDFLGVIGGAFGTNCSAGSCSLTVGQEQWYVEGSNFFYALAFNPTGGGFGTVTVSQAVPEPSTLILLSAGLGGLAVTAFRRRSTLRRRS